MTTIWPPMFPLRSKKKLLGKPDFAEILNRRALEKRLPHETFEQSFAHCFTGQGPRDPVGQQLLATMMKMSGPDNVAKGAVDEASEGGKPPVERKGNALSELEKLAETLMAHDRKLSKQQAFAEVYRARPDLASAERTERLGAGY
jgi:hypothetical protein